MTVSVGCVETIDFLPPGHELGSHHCGSCCDGEMLGDRNDSPCAVTSVLGREQRGCWKSRRSTVGWTRVVKVSASSHCAAPALRFPLDGVCAWGVPGGIIPVLSGQLATTLVKTSCGISWLFFYYYYYYFLRFLSTMLQMSIFSHASTWASRFKGVCLRVQACFCFPSVPPFLQKACCPWEPRWVLLGFL